MKGSSANWIASTAEYTVPQRTYVCPTVIYPNNDFDLILKFDQGKSKNLCIGRGQLEPSAFDQEGALTLSRQFMTVHARFLLS